jgi:hypothetical protein
MARGPLGKDILQEYNRTGFYVARNMFQPEEIDLLRRAAKEDREIREAAEPICFAPELLAPDIYYARTFQGMEESDKWIESLLLKQTAERCFASAKSF